MLETTDPTDQNCIFCTKGFIEKSFCTTSHFSAFYNIAPILPGHSLIIPNKHYESLFELTDDELSEMMLFARKITSVLKTVFNCDGFDWTIQDGVSAGQTVPHLHLHVIPRKPMDLPDNSNWYNKIRENENNMLDSDHRERLNDQDYDAITARLAEAVKSSTISM
jgi:bis(5'-adenosyl)-triphosphatase